MDLKNCSFQAWVPMALVVTLVGCAQLTPVSQSEICQSAVSHLGACGAAMPSLSGVACDPIAAQAMMDLPCDELGQLSALGAYDNSSDYIPKSGKRGFQRLFVLVWVQLCVPRASLCAQS